MPRYFFDSFTQTDMLIDDYGMELIDASEAIDQAEEITKKLISENRVIKGSISAEVRVRSANGDVIYIVSGGISSRKNVCATIPLPFSDVG